MERSRRVAVVLTLACAGVFVVGIAGLARRIGEFNAAAGRTMYAFNEVHEREFQFAGRKVSLTDEEREGQTVVVVQYGDAELRLIAPREVDIGSAQLPGLARHSEWLRVLRFAPFKGRNRTEFKEHLDEGTDRLAILSRRPAVGPDPHTGEVWNRDWLFEFRELLPDGTIAAETLRYPKTKGDKNPKPGELRAGTWEMDAAMGMMPGSPPDSLNFGRPTAAFKDDALRNAGWTLPAAVAGALGLVASLAVLLGPRRAKGGTGT
jgi:hypothetical protein